MAGVWPFMSQSFIHAFASENIKFSDGCQKNTHISLFKEVSWPFGTLVMGNWVRSLASVKLDLVKYDVLLYPLNL